MRAPKAITRVPEGVSDGAALFPASGHDHAACITSARERAERVFEGRGIRMTPLRARVLQEVSASHGAIGAYEILDRISSGGGKRLAPISVYRALDTLVSAGIVHRLESRNAYFVCQQSHAPQHPYLVLICNGCGQVAEAPAENVWNAISSAMRKAEFAFEGSLVEVVGRCGTCRSRAAAVT